MPSAVFSFTACVRIVILPDASPGDETVTVIRPGRAVERTTFGTGAVTYPVPSSESVLSMSLV